jgi:hypothetical protein
MPFPIEQIPDTDKLYYRIHLHNIDKTQTIPQRRIKPGAFDPQPKPHSTEMSVNWNKYLTPFETQNSARIPEKNGVVSFVVEDVRNTPINLKVNHKPTINRAHSIIFDVDSKANDPEIRINLRRICSWEIVI